MFGPADGRKPGGSGAEMGWGGHARRNVTRSVVWTRRNLKRRGTRILILMWFPRAGHRGGGETLREKGRRRRTFASRSLGDELFSDSTSAKNRAVFCPVSCPWPAHPPPSPPRCHRQKASARAILKPHLARPPLARTPRPQLSFGSAPATVPHTSQAVPTPYRRRQSFHDLLT